MRSLTRNLFLIMTVAVPLACGDNGGGTTGGSTGGTTGGGTTGGVDTTGTPTTGDPNTTTGMSASGDTTTGDPATTEPPTSDPSTTTGPDLTTTTDVTATTTGDTGTGNETGDPVAQCMMMLPDPNDTCGQCACANCTDELSACQMDEGCTAIRQCAQDNMCGGIDCLGPCGGVINDYGGIGGASGMKALTLGSCISDNCAAECGT